jgi:hypothetical protein
MTALRDACCLGRTQTPVEGNAVDRGWLGRAGGGCCACDGVWPNVDQARPPAEAAALRLADLAQAR